MEKVHHTLKQMFQQEFSKIVAVISRLFGLQHIETAEDIAGETFLLAAETWEKKGIPENPAAWLYVVAKQKTLYYLRRNKILENKIIPELMSRMEEIKEPDFSLQNIKDSQLRMFFAVCHPAVAAEAQIGLALRILCGFSIDEIAEAFFSSKETINKRLYRAKEKLRSEKIELELPSDIDISERLNSVLHIIYLLFNEGYYSRTQNRILRKDLCLDALRLGLILSEYEITNVPKTNALIALMCFHASRFSARQTENNLFIPYEKQDENMWDKELINRGIHFLNLSAQGREISSYHLEARIAYLHYINKDSREKWEEILDLYNRLLMINYSVTASLNRLFALYKVYGYQTAIAEAEKLKMDNNHFYFLLLGELYKKSDRNKAECCLQKAYSLAGTQTEKEVIQRKINELKP